jgi:hypothetical protein
MHTSVRQSYNEMDVRRVLRSALKKETSAQYKLYVNTALRLSLAEIGRMRQNGRTDESA